jgi:hypothetical protein
VTFGTSENFHTENI